MGHPAGIAQLVERDLAKVGVEGPSSFSLYLATPEITLMEQKAVAPPISCAPAVYCVTRFLILRFCKKYSEMLTKNLAFLSRDCPEIFEKFC